jgi:hypothetical protein
MLAALPPMPLVRITPVDGVLEPGPDDPGGGGWVWRQLVVLGATIAAVRLVRRAGRALVAGVQWPS